MQASAPPPASTEVKAETKQVVGGFIGILALIPAIFALVFHLGAAYLSYKKYSSIGWATLDFFFAVFYYPYYAFFLSGDSTPVAEPAPLLQAAGKRRRR